MFSTFKRLFRWRREAAASDLQKIEWLPKSVWCLDFLWIEADRLMMNGWALVPTGKTPVLRVNQTLASTTGGLPRPDLEVVMAHDPRAPTAGFHAELPGYSALLAQADELELSLCDAATAKPFVRHQSFFWPLHTTDRPFPDSTRRKRVHGNENSDGFIINGYTTFRTLTRALGRYFKGWEDFPCILDWGCGCGRVFRHLPDQVLARLVGVDVDEDNIAWCQRHFPQARFELVPLHPPTVLRADHFDLVIGISVFTHLREEVQFQWLAELARLARRGAYLLVTILGPLAGGRANLSIDQAEAWRRHRYLMTGQNVDLRDVIPEEGYYINALHFHDYVRTAWGKYFEILAIQPGAIANHQDLVVMRKR